MGDIRGIIFDLDGVLVNSRILHFETFRDALYSILGGTPLTWAQHETLYDGLSTRLKLQKCIVAGLCNEEQVNAIFQKKQELTKERICEAIHPRPGLYVMLNELRKKGYYLACASNSIRSTLDQSLDRLGIRELFHATYANQDVKNPKPSPDIYNLAMEGGNLLPTQTLIVEDSIPGRQAAYASRAHVLEVEDAEDTTLELVEETLEQIRESGKVKSRIAQQFQVIIPMAGEGSRFQKAGYTTPKPFIDVGGKPMIQWVLENMMPKTHDYHLDFHLIVRHSHLEKYPMGDLLNRLPKQHTYKIHTTNGLTEGAACSVLLAEQEINNEIPLVIVNSDQYLEWNPDEFYRAMLNPRYDGCILTFFQPDPSDMKWSYAATDANGEVTNVAEKKWISPNATVGLYGWRRGSDFVRYAKEMIAANRRVNNEFYVCPVYNEIIANNGHIRTKLCKGMWGLGVPEDLENFRSNFLQKNV